MSELRLMAGCASIGISGNGTLAVAPHLLRKPFTVGMLMEIFNDLLHASE